MSGLIPPPRVNARLRIGGGMQGLLTVSPVSGWRFDLHRATTEPAACASHCDRLRAVMDWLMRVPQLDGAVRHPNV